MERLADPSNYANDPEEAWKRVKVAGRKPDVLGRLRALAKWRELEAQGKDLPRGRIVKTRRWPTWPAIRRGSRATWRACAACPRAGRPTISARG